MLKRIREKDGYMTIEITLIFTLILFSLLLIIYLGICLYQQVALQSSVQIVASQGATMYASGSTEIVTAQRSLASYKNQNPYVNFLDGSIKTTAENNIRIAIEAAVNQNEVYKGSGNATGARIERKFISQKVVVNATRDYTMPIVSVGKTFGLSSPLKVDVWAAAPVTDPVEVIRTTDICVDALMYFEETAAVIGKLGHYKGKVIELIQGLDISETEE